MFDLDAYFARIGYEGPREASLATLQAIHALHPQTIAFEALDPFLGRTVSLDLHFVQKKLVGQKRGGYCFEQNAVLMAALERLGFAITPWAGRVVWMRPPEAPVGPRTHMLLKADLAEGPFIVDVGFGGYLSGAPLRFEPGLEQKTPFGTMRVMAEERGYRLESLVKGHWQPLYRFTDEPQYPIDYEMGNWFTATHPASLFRNNLLIQRLTEECRLSLLNRRLTWRYFDGGTKERPIKDAADLARTLDEEFGLSCPVAADVLWSKLKDKP